LLLSIGGVLVSIVVADAVTESCGGGDICAYIGMAYFLWFLAAIVPGVLGTGLIVGLLSDDAGLARRAIRVALVILWLTISIF
jgi:hypothetical protein